MLLVSTSKHGIIEWFMSAVLPLALMFTIEETYEVVNANLVEARQEYLSGVVCGLGPDDLVSLTKDENGLFWKKTIHCYHHVRGLVVDSVASFAAYFAWIIEHQEQSVLQLSKAFSIRKGRLFCFNSFVGRDIVITVKCPGGCSGQTANKAGKMIKVSAERWNQARLSAALRFYRGGDPTFASIFGNRVVESPALKVLDGQALTLEDFVYIGEHHGVSDDLQFALSVALFVNLCVDDIRSWLERFGYKFPKVVPHLFSLACPGGKFESCFGDLIDSALTCHCDDVAVASVFVDYYLRRNDPDKFKRVFSLLKNALAINPLAGICLAKIYTSRREYEQALVYLNAAGFCEWPQLASDFPQHKLVGPLSSIPYGPDTPEKYLAKSPLHGIHNAYIEVIGQIAVLLGSDNFNELVRLFMNKRRLSRSNTLHNSLSEDTSTKVAKTDLVHLYDPGIETEPSAFEGLDTLPTSKPFKAAIREVQRSLVLYRLLKKSGPKVTDDTSKLILAVRWNDTPFMNAAIRHSREKRSTTTLDKLIMIRGWLAGTGSLTIPEILALPAPPRTLTERNAMHLVARIADASIRHDT